LQPTLVVAQVLEALTLAVAEEAVMELLTTQISDLEKMEDLE
jgi:hypothetical protein